MLGLRLMSFSGLPGNGCPLLKVGTRAIRSVSAMLASSTAFPFEGIKKRERGRASWHKLQLPRLWAPCSGCLANETRTRCGRGPGQPVSARRTPARNLIPNRVSGDLPPQPATRSPPSRDNEFLRRNTWDGACSRPGHLQ
jgi:hypothetical protein